MTSVLIIDDNRDDREWITDLAQRSGFDQVVAFDTIDAALDYFRQHPTDVVILDDWLGGQRGWAYAPSFALPDRATRVVIVSGVAFPNVLDLSRALNVEFLEKGEVSLETLQRML